MKKIKVYINSKNSQERKIVEAEFLKRNNTTIHVRLLHDNNVIKRRIDRDLPEGLNIYED